MIELRWKALPLGHKGSAVRVHTESHKGVYHAVDAVLQYRVNKTHSILVRSGTATKILNNQWSEWQDVKINEK